MAPNQALISLRIFLSRFPGLYLRQGYPVPKMPEPRLVIRIGAAGHLNVTMPSGIMYIMADVFAAMDEYARRMNLSFHKRLYGRTAASGVSPHELRLVSQLAPGFDQIAATAAYRSGRVKLHTVLPGSEGAFKFYLEGFPGQRHSSANPQTQPLSFEELYASAAARLELDSHNDLDTRAPLTDIDFEQAGSVILQHSDIVVIGIHDSADGGVGGTKWVETQARQLRLPVIRIPIERPSDAEMWWFAADGWDSRRLYNSAAPGLRGEVFDAALTRALLGDSDDIAAQSLGSFERRYVAQLDANFNATYWDERWHLPTSPQLTGFSLGDASEQIDRSLKAVKVWADHRASAMAELVRGSFILCALLGATAVLGALLGLVLPDWSKPGKVMELICLGLIVWFVVRARRMEWRAHWLSLRQLERYVDQASWLLLLGRSRIYSVPAQEERFHRNSVSQWANTYLRAVFRDCPFPTVCLDQDYIRTVQSLAWHNVIENQIDFYQREIECYRNADAALEIVTRFSAGVAVLVTFVYLAAFYGIEMFARLPYFSQLSPSVESFLAALNTTGSRYVTFAAALMPSIAAAMAAIRSRGEYMQISTRFEGTRDLLLTERERSAPTRSELGPGGPAAPPVRSAALARTLIRVTGALIQEVLGWRAILTTKDIEAM